MTKKKKGYLLGFVKCIKENNSLNNNLETMSEKIQYENGVPTPFPSPAKIMIDSKNLDEVSTPTSSQKDLHEESKLQVPERKRSTTLRNAINKIKGGELISSHKLPKHQSMERENPDSEAKKGVINTIFRRKRKGKTKI